MGVLISFLCAFACAAIGGLIYSILTITLRVNQNVTGLALTIFGTGFGNFFGGSISKLAGGVGQISVKVTGSAYTAKIPGLSKIPVIGGILFNYGFLTYLCIIIAVLLSFFLFKTRAGLNLRQSVKIRELRMQQVSMLSNINICQPVSVQVWQVWADSIS